MLPVAIVLVEDDPGHARLIEKNIRRAGVTNDIGHFASGTAALDHLMAHDGTPTLVLLDLNLPDMSGTRILEALKSNAATKHIPVIVLTTTDDKVEIQKCYDLGCNVYITKPVDYEAFATAIRQLGLFLSVMKVPEPT
ncbi:MAG TPA: response regulator [Alphaproteobacteria bacterium]|jgi:CheY-like chemotaxis protein|nr:response regulator [Alphaproteobacteria bacterium]